MAKTGRPSKFDKALCLDICDDIASGKSLRQACEERGIATSTAMGWFLDDQDGVFAHYARARKLQAEKMFDELLDIADDATNDYMEVHDPEGKVIGYKENGEWTRRSQLRTDIRKWILARMDSKRYGDKVQNEHSGADGGPVTVNFIRGTPPAKGGDAS